MRDLPPIYRLTQERRSKQAGETPPPIRPCAPTHFISGRECSATCWLRCHPTADGRTSAAPTITTRRFRRATHWSRFGLWLRHRTNVDALVHMGAHGTLEWLPGKAVALTPSCFPELLVGPLPVIYPFIVSNPGEAAQAKRRIAAVTIGHLPPALATSGLADEARELERLVDEYAQADGLDRKRRERLARLIIESAERGGLAREAGVDRKTGPDEALRKIDAGCATSRISRSRTACMYTAASRFKQMKRTRPGHRVPAQSATR
jgi:Cobalamin biosynthesis protein CobN and related Mg-chelatases